MLVDAAKYGDVEIPYFCYEPKLGQPVGACRMCLVEIEGIPKLQTSCSTPVRDGMVVVTTSDRVKHAQNAIVEFLLVNHPLDCPVCDKGGECPLQDISFGWGAGRSRFIEPKRHFKKPLELSPLVAIDRERCILCYRCVRFSQEVAEDYQLVFLDRADHTFVGTHDGRPYVAPFSGNIIELCPVGALTSSAYRFRARPVGHRGLRLGLHDVPVAVQRRADAARRRQGRARAGARQRRGGRRLAVRQGPLRLPVLLVARAHHRAAGARRRLPARGLVGARAVRRGARCSSAPASAPPRWSAAARRTRRASSCSACCARGSARRTWTRARRAGCRDARHARWRGPTCRRRCRTSTTPGRSWCSTQSWSTRRRSSTCASARRCGATTRGSSSRRRGHRRSTRTRPRRCASRPGAAEAALGELAAALGSPRSRPAALPGMTPARRRTCSAARTTSSSSGASGSPPASAAPTPSRRCSRSRSALDVAGNAESGLIEVPAGANGRGLREVGCVPTLGPGLEDAAEDGMTAAEIGESSELGALLLVERTLPAERLDSGRRRGRLRAVPERGARRPRRRRLPGARSIRRRRAPSPTRTGASSACGRRSGTRGDVRPAWQVLADLCERLGAGIGALTAPMVTARLAEAVPVYAGITLEEIGGLGLRWQERDAASALPVEELSSERARRAARRAGRAPAGRRAHAMDRARDRALAVAALSLHARASGDLGARTRAAPASRTATR